MDAKLPFLIRSQQRVLEHCRLLLAADELGEDERRKLERLSREAEANLAAMANVHHDLRRTA